MVAYVYLLWHVSEPRFKIGKADDIAVRAAQLGAAQFDFQRSHALALRDCAAAHRLERILHRSFHAYRLTPGEACDDRFPSLQWGRRDGDTEWFSAESANRLRCFLEQNADLFECAWVPHEALQTFGRTAQAVPDQRKAIPCSRPVKPSLAPDDWAVIREELRLKQRTTEQLAHALGTELSELRSISQAMAVMKIGAGYTLVGRAELSNLRAVNHRLRKLEPIGPKQRTVKFQDLYGIYGTGYYFMVELQGEPGLTAQDATCFNSWLAQLVWQQTPAVPGFDMSLQVSEMEAASGILTEIFKVPHWYRANA